MRIIAGKHRGRILRSLLHEGTRPTADRVRESLFSKIQFDVNGGIVLDLFAGTGALGFEALSREAKEVYMIDNSKESCDLIVENNKLLKENAHILNVDFRVALNNFVRDKIVFNVIFLDPPYKTDLAEEALIIIAQNKLLTENGVIVFEHDKEKMQLTVPDGLIIYDQKKYGNTYLTYITLD
ncbi:MAG: 16S rRNA (guanine(966)-N(2))-methyltransferase RsmD [Clostridia bacterium]|nr:16S rRNA (guanine(966)-N(2))-methyltransferase RsmD [Clostridia bacterium]